MKVTDLKPNCKVKNRLGYELVVDKIIDDEIYTSHRNKTLKGFERLRRTKKQIENLIERNSWILLDGKIRITRKELEEEVLNRIGKYSIKEFQEPADRDDADIINKKLVEGDKLYVYNMEFEFVDYIDGRTLLSLTANGNSMNILVEDENLELYSFTNQTSNFITLEDAIRRLYDQPLESLELTD